MYRAAALYVSVFVLASAGTPPMEEQVKEPFRDTTLTLDERVSDLLGRLTLEEKIDLLTGKDNMDTRGVPRLGVPPLKMADGPHGVRWDKATCFPTGISMASTWNPDLVERMGRALAEETLGKGRNILLGPCINIHRTPLGGRNFESFGEDPHLAARMAVAYVRGVQGGGVGTSTKHFAANNQEHERGTISVEISERALREIYLPAFKAAVMEAGTWTVMTAYNKVNGHHCSAHKHLLDELLKGAWGFRGPTISDWGAVHETAGAFMNGQDLEMPGPGVHFGDALRAAHRAGAVSDRRIDDAAGRVLRLTFQLGLLDGAPPAGAVDTPEHRALAREVAEESVTLLKNDGAVLPLDRGRLQRLAVIGPNAAEGRNGGGGSSYVDAPYVVSPLEGIRRLCPELEVTYVQGCPPGNELPAIPAEMLQPPAGSQEAGPGLLGEYFGNRDLAGEPVFRRVDPVLDFDWPSGPGPGIGMSNYSVRWTGRLCVPADGEYDLGTVSDDGSRLFLDGKLVVDNWGDHGPLGKAARVRLRQGVAHEVRLEYYQAWGGAMVRFGWSVPGRGFDEAVEAASSADAAVLCIGLSSSAEGEGTDRHDMALPGDQAGLIAAVAAANPQTVVVFIGGTPVEMSAWLDRVPAVVSAWYPGQEGGHAVARVLFGETNPSGKMVVTFPKRLEDSPAFAYYPGRDGKVGYDEGLYVGYRHFDSRGVEPQFPFGHGLSYTTFAYRDLAVDAEQLRISCEVENTGDRPGREVVQLYLHDVEARLERPFKELKAFEKIALDAGARRRVEFRLAPDALAFFDPDLDRWCAEPGRFEVLVGSSSRDIRLRGVLDYQPASR